MLHTRCFEMLCTFYTGRQLRKREQVPGALATAHDRACERPNAVDPAGVGVLRGVARRGAEERLPAKHSHSAYFREFTRIDTCKCCLDKEISQASSNGLRRGACGAAQVHQGRSSSDGFAPLAFSPSLAGHRDCHVAAWHANVRRRCVLEVALAQCLCLPEKCTCESDQLICSVVTGVLLLHPEDRA